MRTGVTTAILLSATACRTVENIADDRWIDEARAHILTPHSNRVLPERVLKTQGNVSDASNLLVEDGRSCRLRFDKDGAQPFVALDFGKGSVGGYALFKVTARAGLPTLRLSYACHPNGLSPTGCFTRQTSARYLGKTFDLPVLPGNIYRHETYTIPRDGFFIAPLIQGQARYVRLQLDTPGTAADIDFVAMINSEVYDRSPHDGFFLCSDERLNQLWAISTWTLQIASFPNHNAWKTVDGWLLPRKLEQAEDIGLSKKGADWRDAVIETLFELRSNPDHVSAAGVAFRARDTRNAYLAEVSLDGTCRLIRRQNGDDTLLREHKLAEPLTDGTRHRLRIDTRGPSLSLWLDDALVVETEDHVFKSGRVGFYTPKEKWPLFDYIAVKNRQGRVLLKDDFSGSLDQWDFARTLAFVADGAKRDRLVWSGDLYFAQPNEYYAFQNLPYMRDSLKMLAFNQTPDGYVHASPYPERSEPPPLDDYGPFPSDEFAAWLVPVAWEHLLYTADTETLRSLWPSISRLLSYLQNHIGTNNLFVQRPETSKHAGNLNLGDLRTRSFMNILLWGTFRDASRIALELGFAKESEVAAQQAEKIKTALFDQLWDERAGSFKHALEVPHFGPEANALALAMGLLTPEQAKRVAPQFKKIGHGKFQSLASRGLLNYGFAHAGLKMIFDHNWLKLLSPNWQGAWTTTECMGLQTKGWGDESHPDTAIAGHFSAFLLGVTPCEPGYRRFRVRPQPVNTVRWAKGLVPTPHGPIRCEWELDGATFNLSLSVPKGTQADIVLPAGGTFTVNGRQRPLTGLAPGKYRVQVCDLPADAWADPTVSHDETVDASRPKVRASSSHEAGGWSIDNLLAPESETTRKGYSSKVHQSDKAEEWIEIDLNETKPITGLTLLPRADIASKGGTAAGFPSAFKLELATEPGTYSTVKSYEDLPTPDAKGLTLDLYTVIGYPSARFIRLSASRLGQPASDEPDAYRLQLYRIKIHH
ncbi:MAG: alpha-L-rhamnosidase C-terminal domain-containing protein [Kiritimatiellae bacterium]|nr:alpha-L-rhamnosidase C-terminal domain-containing protein [Kiritimatiellia bacterium]